MKRTIFPVSFAQIFQGTDEKQSRFTRTLSRVFFGEFRRKIVHLSLILCFTLLCLLLGGCSLADPAADDSGTDLLVGFFITTEPLQPDAVEPLTLAPAADAADGENAAGSSMAGSAATTGSAAYAVDTSQELARLYAELLPDEYGAERILNFPGVEGWYFANHPAKLLTGYAEDVELTDATWQAPDDALRQTSRTRVTDEGYAIECSGILYYPLTEQNAAGQTFYLNPVYQTADGRVYAVQGGGTTTALDTEQQGAGFGYEEYGTYTVNGEVTAAVNVRYDLDFYAVWEITGYRLVQLDRDGSPLQADAYTVEALPQALELLPETDCLLVERLCVDVNGAEQVVRTALDRSRNFQLWDTSISSLVYSVDFSWAQESGRAQTNLYLATPTQRGTLGEQAIELIYDR